MAVFSPEEMESERDLSVLTVLFAWSSMVYGATDGGRINAHAAIRPFRIIPGGREPGRPEILDGPTTEPVWIITTQRSDAFRADSSFALEPVGQYKTFTQKDWKRSLAVYP